MTNIMTWDEIKTKILFEYLGDWKNIVVDSIEQTYLKDFLDKNVSLKVSSISPDIYSFSIDHVEINFYLRSTIHFDFNPTNIQTLAQWTSIINFLQDIARTFECKVNLNHEGGDETLVLISSTELQYNFEVYDEYRKDKNWC
jgi:hypothetical protein